MNTDKPVIDISNESLEDAANNHSTVGSDKVRFHNSIKHNSFIDGANWQKEQDKQTIDKLIEALKETIGYISALASHQQEQNKFDTIIADRNKFAALLNSIEKDNKDC